MSILQLIMLLFIHIIMNIINMYISNKISKDHQEKIYTLSWIMYVIGLLVMHLTYQWILI